MTNRLAYRHAARWRPRPTSVFDTFWRFAAERQGVYFARLADRDAPWTEDLVLREFRFTNVYRAADRVSQYLIKHVIYQDDIEVSPEDLVFRILLFKIFNRISTWEVLERTVGPPTFRSYDFRKYDRALSSVLASDASIYSAAYIIPSPPPYGYQRKYRNHLALLEQMMRDRLPARLGRARSMEEGFELLRGYPGIGTFLAYQFIVDLNYSDLTDFSENEFVVAGPGAVEGIRKAFLDSGGFSHADVIRMTEELQHEEFARLGLRFDSLFGRPLHLIDCQNLFCEVAKYSRLAHPEFSLPGGRTRIKQRFSRSGRIACPWFPPKWEINEAVPNRQEECDSAWS